MSMLSIRNLGLTFGHRDIFSSLHAELPRDARVGLVGPNGVGKTSLFRIVAGLMPPTAGSVHLARDTQIGYLRQEAVEAFAGHGSTVLQEMESVFLPVRQMEGHLRDLEQRMAQGDHSATLLEEYGALQEAFEQGGGYDYGSRIEQVLHGLGFGREQWDTPIQHLSGGQKTRALLARLLLERPNLLILDEPTNHLDIYAVQWLERALGNWRGALLVASHDRYFLDRVVDRIWEMSPNHIEVYRGNYSAYLAQREERWERNHQVFESEVERLRRELDLVRRYIAWRKFDEAWGRLQRLSREVAAIKVHGVLGIQGKQWSELGVGRTKMMEIEEVHDFLKHLRPPARPPRLHLDLKPAKRSGDAVLRTRNLSVGYNKPLFQTDTIHLERGERVGIIGPNGAGKTTLLRTILQQIPPLAGEVQLGAGLKIGYFAQAHEALDPTRAVLDELLRHRDLTLPEARNHLAKYLFRGDDVHKLVGALSGGERGRLALAILAVEGVNLLLLDEPTNHLDIAAQEVLQEGLAAFPGTVLLVSHDRYLIAHLATQIWEIRNGRLHVFQGSYEEYVAGRDTQEEKQRKERRQQADDRRAEAQRAQAERRKVQQVTALEEAIAAAEAQLSECTRQLEACTDPKAVTALASAFTEARETLDRLVEEWTAVAEL